MQDFRISFREDGPHGPEFIAYHVKGEVVLLTGHEFLAAMTAMGLDGKFVKDYMLSLPQVIEDRPDSLR